MFTDKNGNFDLENFKKYVTDNGNNFVKEGYGLNFLGKKAAELMSGLDSTAVFVEDKEQCNDACHTISNSIKYRNVYVVFRLMYDYEYKGNE